MTLQLKRRMAERLRSHSPRLFRCFKHCVHLATGRLLREDYLDRWTGRRDSLTPPLRCLFDGTQSYAEFARLGDEWRSFLIRHGLQPSHHVLEVGSGNGKNARALTSFLTTGRYEGFDIVAPGIAWCQQNVTPRYPQFRFHHADVRNRSYNPTGSTPACDYRFPFPTGSFDAVFLTSVFTHMLPADLENYVGEMARVLKPGGKCLASFFLLSDGSRRDIAKGQSGRAFPFEYQSPVCRVADREWPEDAVAYDERFVRELFARYSLHFGEPAVRGQWSQGEPNSQDCVVALRSQSL